MLVPAVRTLLRVRRFLTYEPPEKAINGLILCGCLSTGGVTQADLSLVLPPASLPANNLFADWPAGARAWPW